MSLRPNTQFHAWRSELDRDGDLHDANTQAAIKFLHDSTESHYKALKAGIGSGVPIYDMELLNQVRQEASSRADKIFVNYEALHAMLIRHEDTVRKRWDKKTRAQRLKVLLSAWPNMPLTHRPDFDAFQRKADFVRDRGTKYRDCFMWPYINQEDLLTTRALPLLLNARGRHPPSHFAAADERTMLFGMLTKALVPIILGGHAMILNGIAENSRAYGRLVAWEEHPESIDWSWTQMQFNPGEGLLILEAQERLLIGLVQCCQQLLQDIPESEVTSDQFPILPEPQLKSGSETRGFKSLGIMAAEAPYRLPVELDLPSLKSLLSARASAAEDHIWALREDPDYFSTVLLEAKDHRPEFLKDLNGNEHPLASPGGARTLWSCVIRTFICEAYYTLECFSELSLQAENLASLQVKYVSDICPSKDLPKEYSDALVRFRFYLQ